MLCLPLLELGDLGIEIVVVIVVNEGAEAEIRAWKGVACRERSSIWYCGWWTTWK